MSNISIGAVVAVASLEWANRVMDCMGRGPGNFTIALSPTGSGDPTHWGFNEVGSVASGDMLDGLTRGVLPDAPWGQDGHISEADAISACGGGRLMVFRAGPVKDSEHPDSIVVSDTGLLTALESMGLKRYPDPEI